MVLSRRKGSVLDCLIRTLTTREPSLESMDMSDGVRCEAGSKSPSESTVNSPALKNPKKPRQQTTYSITTSNWSARGDQ